MFHGAAFFVKPCRVAQAVQYPKSPNTAANTITSDTASKTREQTGLSMTLFRFIVLMAASTYDCLDERIGLEPVPRPERREGGYITASALSESTIC